MKVFLLQLYNKCESISDSAIVSPVKFCCCQTSNAIQYCTVLSNIFTTIYNDKQYVMSYFNDIHCMTVHEKQRIAELFSSIGQPQ